MKLRARYVWLSVAVLSAIVASGALYVFVISDSAHYQLFHDETSFNVVLNQQIEPGHSIEYVLSLRLLGQLSRRYSGFCDWKTNLCADDVIFLC